MLYMYGFAFAYARGLYEKGENNVKDLNSMVGDIAVRFAERVNLSKEEADEVIKYMDELQDLYLLVADVIAERMNESK